MDDRGLFGSGGDALRGALDRVLAESRVDEDFRRGLLEAPEKTLQEFGFDKGLVQSIAGRLGLFGGKCEDTCISNTGADCKYGTCRVTDACGWTVCDTTKKSTHLPDDPWNGLRVQIDEILQTAARDDSLKSELLGSPRTTLERLGIQGWAVGHVMLELGLGPGKCENTCISNTGADCTNDTCRITDPCGWTVCDTTNKMPGGIGRPDDLRTVFGGAAGRQPIEGPGGGWPDKKKRELWTEPEGFGGVNVDVLRAVASEKKKLELETQPTAGAGPFREELLDQLADEVAARLKRGTP